MSLGLITRLLVSLNEAHMYYVGGGGGGDSVIDSLITT